MLQPKESSFRVLVAATTQRLQVGGGYLVFIETSDKGLVKLITSLTVK